MSRTLNRDEQLALLAEVRIGVLSVASIRPDRGPLAVPIWYSFEPERGISIVTDRDSQKGRAIQAAGRFGMVVQHEAMPYRYVSVEGPVIEDRPMDPERDLKPLAQRYLGTHLGDLYTAAMSVLGPTTFVFTMRPETWLSYTEAAA